MIFFSLHLFPISPRKKIDDENGHYKLSVCFFALSFWKASSLYLHREMNLFRSCCQSVPSAPFGNKVLKQNTLT